MNVLWPGLLSNVRLERLRWLVLGLGSLMLSAEFGRLTTSGATVRITLATCAVVFVLGVWSLQAEALLYFLVTWTVVLGMLRRIVSYEVVGVSAGTDPLLVVQPLVLVLVAAAALRTGALEQRTRLSQAVLVLSVLIGIGALNPLQGSPVAGLTALVFFVPVLAFWAGRAFVDEKMLRGLLTLVAVFALVSVAYGLVQLEFGFPSWDKAWITNQGYSALNVGGTIRQFSSFSSSAEYAYFLTIGAVVWGWLRVGRVPLAISWAGVAILLLGAFYDSTRAVIFLFVGTAGLLLAASRGLRLRAAVAIAAVAVILLPTLVSSVASPSSARVTGQAALISHQLSGLTDPTGKQSTLSGHFSEVVDGFRTALTNPVGKGISLVTIAGSKFGGTSQGTEQDISNVAVALGLPGLVCFVVILWQGFAGAYRIAAVGRSPVALAALGVLGVTFSQWLNGGQYAIAYLPWLILGWVDRTNQKAAEGISSL